jgi:NitT/TauT family transport system ATP-binding protein
MIEIKDLYVKYYNNNKIALNGISFSVQKGELVAILGPSGVGKTTLLNLIGGIISSSKEVEIKGSVILGEKKEKLNINMVFQSPTLLPWRKVAGNISYGLETKKIPKEIIDEKAKEAIVLVGLEGAENYYPHELSLGMQQRVNFARALVCEPDILLLDEPFSSLDIKTKNKIQEEFLKIIKEKHITVIFVTHNPEEAFFMADKIVVFTKSPAKIKTIIDNKDKKKPENMAEHLEFYE